MILALILGAGVGLGLVLVLDGLRPARPSLAAAVAQLHRAAPLRVTADESPPPAIVRAARVVATSVGLHRLLERSVDADLRVAEESIDDHVTTRALVSILGGALAPATAALMALGGVRISATVPTALAPILAVAGFLVPGISLRSLAAERRHSFRHALSSYLDLVAVTLAGGAGVETALYRSADTGRGWAFDEIRHALTTSRLLGQTPWAGLERLGTELGVVELQELAASVTLAGEDGARVRASIAAKARAIRTRGLTDTEAAAQAATERMSLPIVLLMIGFMVFVIYPAIDRIITGL